MKLLTKALREKLLKNSREQSRGTVEEKDFIPVVKFFNPCGGATWLFTELNHEDQDTLFGLCDLGQGDPELGNVSLNEISTFRGRFGLGIERDKWFEGDKPLSEYTKAARKADRIIA